MDPARGLLLIDLEGVQTDNHPFPPLDFPLVLEGRFIHLGIDPLSFQGLPHPTKTFDFIHDLEGFFLYAVCEILYIIGASQRVADFCHPCLVCKDLLGPQGQSHRRLCWKGHRLIIRTAM